jgi:hypothetical protein
MKKGATGSIFGSGSDPDSNGSVDPEPGNADRGRPKLSKKRGKRRKKTQVYELESGFSTMPGSGTGFCQSGLKTRSILERKFSKDDKNVVHHIPHTYEYYRR